MQGIRFWCGGLLAGLLVGCGSGVSPTDNTLSDPLTFQTTSMPVAYLSEDFNTSVAVLGGAGPYGYRVVAGALPPGLKLQNGSIVGRPTKVGSYTFSIEANDSKLNNKVIQYTMNVSELPPIGFKMQLPPAEIRGETRIPLLLEAPRNVRAARVQWDVGKDVTVTGVQAENNNVAFWKQSGTMLTVDFGFKVVPKSGSRIALVSVKPSAPVTLNSNTVWYEARDGAGKLLGEKKAPAPAPTPDAPKAQDGSAAPAPADSTATPGTDAPPAPKPQNPEPQPAPQNPAPTTPDPANPNPTNPAPANPAPNPTTPPGGK